MTAKENADLVREMWHSIQWKPDANPAHTQHAVYLWNNSLQAHASTLFHDGKLPDEVYEEFLKIAASARHVPPHLIRKSIDMTWEAHRQTWHYQETDEDFIPTKKYRATATSKGRDKRWG